MKDAVASLSKGDDLIPGLLQERRNVKAEATMTDLIPLKEAVAWCIVTLKVSDNLISDTQKLVRVHSTQSDQTEA